MKTVYIVTNEDSEIDLVFATMGALEKYYRSAYDSVKITQNTNGWMLKLEYDFSMFPYILYVEQQAVYE